MGDAVYIDARTDDEMQGTRVAPGDVLLNITGASLGRCAIAPPNLPPSNVNQHVCIIRAIRDRVDSSFLQRAISSQFVQSQIFSFENGSSREGLNFQQVRSLQIPCPAVEEQSAIADFLDAQTEKLDTLIAKKRALIEKLKEKRAALISRTVTRGLPPDAARAAGLDPEPPLKPSGVEWLGDVPAHWQVTQLRREALVLDCKHRTVPFIDEGVPVASIREVHGVEVDLSASKRTTVEDYLEMIEGGRNPCPGDIIYSRNATVGDAALVVSTERFCMGQDVCLIRPTRHDSRYFLYLLRSNPLQEQAESLMIGSTFRRINVGQIKAFWIAAPPVDEQRILREFLDSELRKAERVELMVQQVIERLQEYRTALITAAVTGKIDVRDWARVPEPV